MFLQVFIILLQSHFGPAFFLPRGVGPSHTSFLFIVANS